MQKFNIAVASKANAIRWINKEVTFTELVDKLKNTIVTDETIDEYKSFNKLAKQQAKDHGGFVGGKLKGTKRRNADEVEIFALSSIKKMTRTMFINLSTDKYKRVVYQFNDKFKKNHNCKTPTLDEEDIIKAFIKAIAFILKIRILS